jgi:hypothetical protein
MKPGCPNVYAGLALVTPGLPATAQWENVRTPRIPRLPDFGHIEIEITINDPKMYTKPWTVKENPHYVADTELMEYICNENEEDLSHLVGKQSWLMGKPGYWRWH